MIRVRSSRGTLRLRWWLLLLAALAMRAGVPAGWMPSATGVGFALCGTGAPTPTLAQLAPYRGDGAPVTIAANRWLMAHDDAPTPEPKTDHPCDTAAGPALLAALPLLTAPPVPAAPAPARAPALAPGRGLAAPPPPATGPPALA